MQIEEYCQRPTTKTINIYIHIPFCKQACHYCDFHFSTQMGKKEEMVAMICRELEMRKGEVDEVVETIYFGGGTPSVLSTGEIDRIIETVYDNYRVVSDPEITLEANPDDLTQEKVLQLAESPINRLSIGVQSFHDHDLKLMNRAHDAKMAVESLAFAKAHFNNLSIDLIYGIPGLTDAQWQENLDKAIALDIPHISSYALTVEDGTALKRFIEKEIIPEVDEEQSQRQYYMLLDAMERAGYVNYEFSNFGKPGFFSQNNTAYWQGKSYLGIGPGAHSYDGNRRAWNISNNPKYIKSISANNLPQDTETLSPTDKFNEYVMTRLRTQNGIDLDEVVAAFGQLKKVYILKMASDHIKDGRLVRDGRFLKVTRAGKFLTDGIAADLFMVNLAHE